MVEENIFGCRNNLSNDRSLFASFNQTLFYFLVLSP